MLRHSFATNFIKNGGDPFVLKSMMGHTSMSTTSIYIHMGRDFNNLKGVNYDGI
ncbi:MAG: site-specific integrase [Clostridia bacterium]|nr:site-specific integrase [Clostridia bacterium]